MKYCTGCNQEKPLTDFYNNKAMKDGKSNYCKKCQNKATSKWRSNNIDQSREIGRQNKRDERKRKGKKHFRDAYNKWYQNNKEHKQQYVTKRRKEDKEKIKAQNKLNKAVQSGKVLRPSRCGKCNQIEKVDGHHYDYSKPYDVIWLCRSCHMSDHSNYL